MALSLLDKYDELDLSGVTPGHRFVLLVYCNKADRWTNRAGITVPYLERATGMTERSINRARQDLVARGMLKLINRSVGGRRASVYEVTIGVHAAPPEQIPPHEREKLKAWGLLA